MNALLNLNPRPREAQTSAAAALRDTFVLLIKDLVPSYLFATQDIL